MAFRLAVSPSRDTEGIPKSMPVQMLFRKSLSEIEPSGGGLSQIGKLQALLEPVVCGWEAVVGGIEE